MSYYYDWQVDKTNDPKFLSGLPLGHNHCKILLDGEDIGNVVRCQTGMSGWVEIPVFNEDGTRQVTEAGNATGKVLRGNVEFIYTP